jgi:2-polyprenyl-6-methoxyphenol hydroxylase-like FAD-dependent oxidoreductase
MPKPGAEAFVRERVAVVGAGIGGLSCALALAGGPFEITLYERDPAATSSEETPDTIALRRRGVPQAVHPHFFMGRLREALGAKHPELLARLAAAGAGEGRFEDSLHPLARSRTSLRASDARLTSIAARRTTFERVMRAYVEERGYARVRSGVEVIGLLGEPGTPPRVRGLRIREPGGAVAEVAAEVVVDASGRAGSLARELPPLGVQLAEERHDAGIIYFTRHYALLPGRAAPASHGIPGLIFPDFIVGALPSDRGAFTVTFQVQRDDAELMAVVRDPERFQALCMQLPVLARWVSPALARPTSDVFGFGGMDSFWRSVVVGGEPRVLGLHFVGDTAVRSNPKYGRGCTWSLLGAERLAESLVSEPTPRGRALRYAAALEAQLRAEWRTMLAMDAAARERFEVAIGRRPATLAHRAREAFATLVDEAQVADGDFFRAIWTGYHGLAGMSDWMRSPAAWLRLGRHALARRARAPLLADRRVRPTRAEILAGPRTSAAG